MILSRHDGIHQGQVEVTGGGEPRKAHMPGSGKAWPWAETEEEKISKQT